MTFVSDATVEAKSIPLTVLVAEAVGANRTQLQLRVRFTTEINGNATSDQALFRSAATAPTPDQIPELVVTYLP